MTHDANLTGDADASGFADAALRGLGETPKTLPCQYLYDTASIW